MPNSYPSNVRQLAALGGILLLALVLTTGTSAAQAADRTPSPAPSHSTRDLGHPAATGLETCPGSGAAAKPAAGTQAHDGAVAPPGSGTPAASHSQASPRDKAVERGGGSRLLRRSGDGRVAPRAPIEEPRRGGVGTLIGITFA